MSPELSLENASSCNHSKLALFAGQQETTKNDFRCHILKKIEAQNKKLVESFSLAIWYMYFGFHVSKKNISRFWIAILSLDLLVTQLLYPSRYAPFPKGQAL